MNYGGEKSMNNRKLTLIGIIQYIVIRHAKLQQPRQVKLQQNFIGKYE